ncbi:hypothetical protein ESCAB7627_3488 [Escherichia albertii TW07627]|uniref:Uncharacterized protein n=1 Tax=Escherichia albertii (strain TW07627) TaxID=502347 RepID=A0ABC9NKM6_ESCAT|nr:hypothetical protein [Escherichia albertii]EDS90704.1 hypothetical protein ESCAB7627_3488 [Escherichia albertii TW07627]
MMGETETSKNRSFAYQLVCFYTIFGYESLATIINQNIHYRCNNDKGKGTRLL